MHAVARARGGTQAEAAVQQRVPRLQIVRHPIALRLAAAAREFHPRRRGHAETAHRVFRAPDVVVRQLEEVQPEHRQNREGPRPTVLLHVEQRALGTRLFRDRPERQREVLERRFVIDDDHRAERVRLRADLEDFVFRVARMPVMRRVHAHRLVAEIALHVLRTLRGRDRRDGRPVNHRMRHVHVLREQHVRQVRRRAMHVRVPAEPPARRHVRPAREQQSQRHRRGGDGERIRQREKFLSALDHRRVAPRRQRDDERIRQREKFLSALDHRRVAPRRQRDDERMRGQRRVHLVHRRAAKFFITHRASIRRGGVREKEFPILPPHIQPRRHGRARGGIDDFAAEGNLRLRCGNKMGEDTGEQRDREEFGKLRRHGRTINNRLGR